MRNDSKNLIVIGGGAAGFFAAIAGAEMNPDLGVTILEKSSRFLEKVRISGGGRCNVTHACFDPRELIKRYPRGSKELLGAFHRFQPRDTVDWFEARGVNLKIEADGRMFPTTDDSLTIVDCLIQAAKQAGVQLRTNTNVASIKRGPAGRFEVNLLSGEVVECDQILLATGGLKTSVVENFLEESGHTIQPPVPSLFTFNIQVSWLNKLSGVSVESAKVSVPDLDLCERGPLLVTHWGLSGPAILRLSAWGARKLHDVKYRFRLFVDWLPELSEADLVAEFQKCREKQGAKLVVNVPVGGITSRLWESFVQQSDIGRDAKWSTLSRANANDLIRQLKATEFEVQGRSLNKDEFVTCGGVKLSEVNFKTMESRICTGLYFAGEVLDIDGITGGFNFQSAWTTGWIAGNAMARISSSQSA